MLDNPHGLYEITQLKREPKNFTKKQLQREIERASQLRSLYETAQTTLPHLNITNESIKYYASLVSYYTVHQLRQRQDDLIRIFLLCFVYHRYQKLHDHLIGYFKHHVKHLWDESQVAAKDRVYEFRVEHNSHVIQAGHVLRLFTDDTIPKNTPFEQVQTQAYALLGPDEIEQVADGLISHITFDETEFRWEFIDSIQQRFKSRLRLIIKAVPFSASTAFEPLLAAVTVMREAMDKKRSLRSIQHHLPTDFIPVQAAAYLYEIDQDGQIHLRHDRYEFFVYLSLMHGLDSGEIFCQDSVRYRSLEDDLISKRHWQTNKQELIEQAGLPILSMPIEDHLDEFEQLLEARFEQVNQRIQSGENEHISIKKRGDQVRWSLPYPRGSEPINHPFYDDLPQIDINAILHHVNQECHFVEAFSHMLPRYASQTFDSRVLIACLIAWGTNMGLVRMGAVSDIAYHILKGTSDDLIRVETLRDANDLITQAIAEMLIFFHYDIEGVVHSSSDGQKFETAIQTINARHSSKYFGLKKGVVSYTLVANHIPINARVIGANEHESHFVFDILYNNTSDIQPTVHSTDTHGTNQINFAILHLFGYQFAPRYKDIFDKVRTSLYGFKHPHHYQDMVICPKRKLMKKLIIEEWDDIQRVMVSLALKSTTQSIIVGKLSSYARKSRLRRALWEYDHIIHSLYLLDYIDSLPLRRNVFRALNRGENYHQMRRAVSFANFGKLRFTTESDQQIWNECARLLINCILYFNFSILSLVWEQEEQRGKSWADSLLRFISPVAWQHVNFYGHYKFTTLPPPVNLHAVVGDIIQASGLDPDSDEDI